MLKSLQVKDKKQRKLYLKQYLKKQCFKSIMANENLPKRIRWQASFLQNPLVYSISKIKNRCIITNRSHSVSAKLKISRIQLRNLADVGLISNLTKAEW